MILEGEEKGGSKATDEFFDALSAVFERIDCRDAGAQQTSLHVHLFA